MSITLKNRTARSALFLLRENLHALRSYSEHFDPDEIDRLVKAADLVSTSLKKLEKWVGASDESNSAEPNPTDDMIDVSTLTNFLDAARCGRICPSCGGLSPGPLK